VITVVITVVLAAASCGSGGGPTLKRKDLIDPVACQECHPKQFNEWSGSMHAYASQDPVFLAMNARGQRETNHALGDFCVKCHAPMALHEGATQDGTNLASVDASLKGVTCYFCHAAEAVDGTHNNPLALVSDDRLFGPFGDPVAKTPHSALYSPLFDEQRSESAAACGACHDIQNTLGTPIERTYQEWQQTLFADPAKGLTCAANSCHMALPDTGPAPASTVSLDRNRDLHSHAFPGVDVALTSFPQMDAQRAGIQALLDTALLTTVCLSPTTGKIWVLLDNAGSGHGFPSGALQDRRAWVEVTAYVGDQAIYQSGVAAPGATVESAPDADLWMIRDCIYGQDGSEVHMFWQAASYLNQRNQLPGSVTPVVSDQSSFTKSHIKSLYPGGDAVLSAVPDRIAVTVHMKPIGADVLQDLVDSGDLDPTVAAAVPTFTFGNGGTVEWTAAKGKSVIIQGTQEMLSCVVAGNNKFTDTPAVAISHARCPAAGGGT